MEKRIEHDGVEYIVVYDDNDIDHVIDATTSETLDVVYIGYDEVCDEHHWRVVKDDEVIFGLIGAFDNNGDLQYDYTYTIDIMKMEED